MKRLRALLLLGTLIASPIGAPVALAFSSPSCDCCQAGMMCPMHRSQQKQRTSRGVFSPSQQTCMCAPTQHSQAVIPQFKPKANVGTEAVLLPPVAALELAASHPGPAVLNRSVSPPDHPPRR